MFAEIIKSGYNGAVVIEPHYKIGGELSEELLRNPKGSQFSENGFLAAGECIDAVYEILDTIKEG